MAVVSCLRRTCLEPAIQSGTRSREIKPLAVNRPEFPAPAMAPDAPLAEAKKPVIERIIGMVLVDCDLWRALKGAKEPNGASKSIPVRWGFLEADFTRLHSA